FKRSDRILSDEKRGLTLRELSLSRKEGRESFFLVRTRDNGQSRRACVQQRMRCECGQISEQRLRSCLFLRTRQEEVSLDSSLDIFQSGARCCIGQPVKKKLVGTLALHYLHAI